MELSYQWSAAASGNQVLLKDNYFYHNIKLKSAWVWNGTIIIKIIIFSSDNIILPRRRIHTYIQTHRELKKNNEKLMHSPSDMNEEGKERNDNIVIHLLSIPAFKLKIHLMKFAAFN